MMDIIEEVIKAHNEEIEKLRVSLGNGSAEDYSHYRQMVGSISSIGWSLHTIKQIIKKRTYADEEE